MATNQTNQTWAVSDLTFVEIAVEHPIQKQMHIAFQCGTCIVISQREQIPLAAELIEYLRNHSRTQGGAA